MGSGARLPRVQRTWTVALRTGPTGPVLTCPRCGALSPASASAGLRAAALAHLAYHARSETLAAHLRTCRCAEHGCRWHPRHRGCEGPLVMALARHGRTWRLTDACRACAAATAHCAAVPEPPGPVGTTADSAHAGPLARPPGDTAVDTAGVWEDGGLYEFDAARQEWWYTEVAQG